MGSCVTLFFGVSLCNTKSMTEWLTSRHDDTARHASLEIDADVGPGVGKLFAILESEWHERWPKLKSINE
jgi:hypothetical protein